MIQGSSQLGRSAELRILQQESPEWEIQELYSRHWGKEYIDFKDQKTGDMSHIYLKPLKKYQNQFLSKCITTKM